MWMVILSLDDNAAAFDRRVPADAEVVPVDDGSCGEAGAGAAVGVRAEAAELDLEGDRLGDVADRELAIDEEVLAVGPDAGGAEGHLRVGVDIEEVAAAQVPVALVVAGRDGRQVDLGLGVTNRAGWPRW